MRKQENAPEKQDREFIASIVKNLPILDSATRQKWIESPRALKKLLAGLVPVEASSGAVTNDPQAELARWVALYKSDFGIELDPVAISVPPTPSYPARLIVVAKG